MERPGLIPSWHGAPVRDPEGAWLGVVEEVLFEERSPVPAWLVVRCAQRACVIPAREVRSFAAHVEVPWDEATLTGAPDTGVSLTFDAAIRLARWFGQRGAPALHV